MPSSPLAAFFSRGSREPASSSGSTAARSQPLKKPSRLRPIDPREDDVCHDAESPAEGVSAEDAQDSEAQSSEDEEDVEELLQSETEVDDKQKKKKKGNRLWDGFAVHPLGARNWQNTQNCDAACNYVCPCGQTCLGKIGGAVEMYKHRQALRAAATKIGQGGLRDALRDELERAYDSEKKLFLPQFRIGNVPGICVRAFGVAAGVGEDTFASAAADVSKDRPRHAGRVKAKEQRQSAETEAHHAWIREMRSTMEGDKKTGKKWYTAKVRLSSPPPTHT